MWAFHCDWKLLWKITAFLFLISKDFIYSFLERRGLGEKEWERNIYQLPLTGPPLGTWLLNPGMCPDQELYLWPFGLRDEAQPTEPYQSGKSLYTLDSFKSSVLYCMYTNDVLKPDYKSLIYTTSQKPKRNTSKYSFILK